MTKKLTEHTFARGGVVPAGHVVWLTAEQSEPRRHRLDVAPDTRPRGKRIAVVGREALYFKAGETVAFDGAIPRTVEAVLAAPEATDPAGTPAAEDVSMAAEAKAAQAVEAAEAKAAEAVEAAEQKAAQAVEAAEAKAAEAVEAAEQKAAQAVEAAEERVLKAEREQDRLSAELANLSTDLVSADAAFHEAQGAVDGLPETASEEARATASSALEAANERLGAVEQSIADFLKGFVPKADGEGHADA